MDKFSNEQIILIVLSLLIGLIVGYFVFEGDRTENIVDSFIENNQVEGKNDLIINEDKDKSKDKKEEKISNIKVYITGSVKRPGVYNMKDGDRIIDIFQKAGGESVGANLEKINMASYIKDGEKIYIPNVSDKGNNSVQNISNAYSSDEKININFASKEELEKLSGIGSSKAKSIIKYRDENGRFNSIKELIKVNGIGTATLNNIEDEVNIR